MGAGKRSAGLMVVYLLAQGNFYDSLILNMTYDSLLDWAMNREKRGIYT